eukprot:364557-Chlamydomonas_euryale.AAC.34
MSPSSMCAWQSDVLLTHRPTFAQAGYLKELGITAVELLPVFEYDELEFQRHENPRSHMVGAAASVEYTAARPVTSAGAWPCTWPPSC